MSKLFSTFPVNNVEKRRSKNNSLIQTFPFCDTFNKILLILSVLEFSLYIKHLIEYSESIQAMLPINFYLAAISSILLLRRLSIVWPALMNHWKEKEEKLLNPYYSEYKPNIATKNIIIWFILLLLVVSEHLFYFTDKIFDTTYLIQVCNITDVEYWNLYIQKFRPQWLSIFNYNGILVIPIEWVDMCLKTGLTVRDALLISISIGLSERFKQWNSRMTRYTKKIVPERIWSELRNDYTCLTELVFKVDRHVSIIILVSCASNLLQICVFLFQSFA